jgi:excisionase family DNA binding protein
MSSDAVAVSEAARALGVSVDTIHRWFDDGTLDGFRLPSGHRRILLDSIEHLRASVTEA